MTFKQLLQTISVQIDNILWNVKNGSADGESVLKSLLSIKGQLDALKKASGLPVDRFEGTP